MTKSLEDLIKLANNELFEGILKQFYNTTILATIDYVESDSNFDNFIIELPNFEATINITKLEEIINHRVYLLRTKLLLLIWKQKSNAIEIPKNSCGLFLENNKIIFKYKLVRKE